MGPGGRAVEPARAPEPPWRAVLESRSLPKEPLGHSPEPNQAQATSSRPPASLHRLRVFLTLEADSDRLLGQEHRASLGNGCDSVDKAAPLPLEVIIPYSAKETKNRNHCQFVAVNEVVVSQV